MRLRLQLVNHQVLEGFRLAGRGKLTFSEFLETTTAISECIKPDRYAGWLGKKHRDTSRRPLSRPTLMLPSMSFFTGEKATDPMTSGLDNQIMRPSHTVYRMGVPRNCHTKHGCQGIGSFQELARVDGIVLVRVDRHVWERFLERVKESAAGRNGRHCDSLSRMGFFV